MPPKPAGKSYPAWPVLLLPFVLFGGFFVYSHFRTTPTVYSSSSTAPPAETTLTPPAPLARPTTRDEVRANYLRDRDLVRKAKPKTEDDVTRLVGRPPDNVLELPKMTMVQWYYEDKPDGRDVLQVTVQNGKITLMDL